MVVVAMPTAHCLDGDGGKGGSTYEKILWSEFAGDGKRLTRSSSARQKRRRAVSRNHCPLLSLLAFSLFLFALCKMFFGVLNFVYSIYICVQSPMSLAPHLPALAKTEDLHWSPALKDLSSKCV